MNAADQLKSSRFFALLCVAWLGCVVAVVVGSQETPWWLFGAPRVFRRTLPGNPAFGDQNCENLTTLDDRQRVLCAMNQDIAKIVGAGAQVGIEECQHQFRMRRWNCSIPEDIVSYKPDASILNINSREKAYLYSVCSAGAAWAVARTCARGGLPLCSCDERVRRTPTFGEFEWGGCSEDIRFGTKFSAEFVDSRERRHIPEGLMNLHNNEAGRRILRENLQQVCKCHGVSGACTTKVCWRKMRPFRAVGDHLFDKFEGATLVAFRRGKKRLRPIDKIVKKPTKRDLVYLQPSPDYCDHNETLGILGTSGRVCNRTSPGVDGCDILCCGRGYKTLVRDIQEQCNCEFSWKDTRVVCKWCVRLVEEYRCN